MGLRAQISLQFTDEELFQNFIVPSKEQKVLNSLIVKCLSAYYYNDEARNVIEGTQGVSQEPEEQKSSQALFDDIRTSLMMQDFFATELRNTIEAGTEDVSNILNRTNDAMEKAGVVQPKESEYGAGVFKVGGDVKQIASKEASSGESDKSLALETIVQKLFEAVRVLAKSSGNTEVESILSDSSDEETKVEEPVVQETQSQIEQSQVLTNPQQPKAVFTDESGYKEEFVEDDEPVEVVEDSAGDAMDDLLASLGI